MGAGKMTVVAAGQQVQAQPEPKRYVRELVCCSVVAACTAQFWEHLGAIILTGSMARDEASIFNDHGRYILLGDADFLLMFMDETREPNQAHLRRVASDIAAGLRRQGVHAEIGLATVRPRYFRSLPAHSYTFELKAHGATVWGNTQALSMIPTYSKEQLSREDAWQTLSNRIVELLGSVRKVDSNSQPVPQLVHYSALKLCLDMATSYLIFAGAYEPTYKERSRRLSELARRPGKDEDNPGPLGDFADLINRCTAWKLQPEPTHEEETRKLLDQAIWHACQLWRWEAAQLGEVDRNCSVETLIGAVAARQGWARRLRGWISMLHRIDRFRVEDCIRWTRFVSRVTPRYLVYWSAVELLFRLPWLLRHEGHPSGREMVWKEVRELLPALREPDSDPCWQDVAADVMWNYERFLIGTNA